MKRSKKGREVRREERRREPGDGYSGFPLAIPRPDKWIGGDYPQTVSHPGGAPGFGSNATATTSC